MRHDFQISGPGFRLRPVTDDDSDFIIKLRTDPALGRFINASSGRREDQLKWLEAYHNRVGDYYFIITRHDGTPEGTIALYDVVDTLNGKQGELGRWVLRHGSLAAVESAMLIYQIAFKQLNLNMVYCRTVAMNEPVVSFHASCGLTTYGIVHNNMIRDGKAYDAIEQRLMHENWLRTDKLLQAQAARLAKRVT